MVRHVIALILFLLMLILPPSVQAHPGPPTDLPAFARPLIWQGSRGPAVADLQRLLNAWIGVSRVGLRLLEVDGIFGPATDAAVRAYQRAQDLAVDGVVGPKTWARILGHRPTKPAIATPAPPRRTRLNTGGRNLYDCSDFGTWEEANAVYRANLPGDPNRLDTNHDGIPCDRLPGAPKRPKRS